MHLVALRLRVDFVLGRREHDVAAGGGEKLAIALESARIRGEILVRCELQAVDEYAGDHEVAALARGAYQRQVTRMQVAHGRHQHPRVLGLESRAQFSDRLDYLHDNSVQKPCSASSGKR